MQGGKGRDAALRRSRAMAAAGPVRASSRAPLLAGVLAALLLALCASTAAAAPALTRVAPSKGTAAGGTAVTISGSGLAAATKVSFGSVAAASFQVTPQGSISAIAPTEPGGRVNVTVTTPQGTSRPSGKDRYTFLPVITSIAPSSGSEAGGTSVTVTGTGFIVGAATSFRFGSAPAVSASCASSSECTIVAPAHHAATATITATVNDARSAAGSAATFTFVRPPTVESVSPPEGSEAGGDVVTIAGKYLSDASAVRFGSVQASSFTVNSATSITAVSPAHGGETVDVTVTTAAGTSATGAGDQFAYRPPVVTAITPDEGPAGGGTSVTIGGAFLGAARSVKFGSGEASSFTVNSETSITANTPAYTGVTSGEGVKVDVTVTTLATPSATSAADEFFYLTPPSISEMQPREGPEPGGTSVTLTGSGYGHVTAVSFGSKSAKSFKVNSESSLIAVAPAGTGTVPVTVTSAGATSAQSGVAQFSYVPPPVVSGLTPSTGTDGTSVLITGSDFKATTAVRFGSASATTFKETSSSTIVAMAPAGSGTVDVTVTGTGGTSATSSKDQFTYVAVPPLQMTSSSSCCRRSAGRGRGGGRRAVRGSRRRGRPYSGRARLTGRR